ncbi:ParB/RepB/Spo0J family partition protein [Umezakia ovalisporum]|uniref:ParB N-terminal domain-containing protein n=2 Tax=Umezakia ovalisporum TaxID=75695 RepID=A0AA43GWM9_9CYAN|nr:ParB N-terminal domain-containing protein [Umezakia ovalisporum]MDH6056841.1 ParB N-terminal domain-containing protein [Umezakia ovalisporum FSS-43]MDH6063081.1 ParB N-terminal domain-containing protein [Umezakia ovalisporum FSS-62]MDH6068692.1 ParB N-terminal domain-containing protein [Umezakia ovalisporum APH033B]MDH6071801.1 ParB N-terminal domain-containing protein [Umezakia ovalisporum CobakiLakeA]MDH6074879.1 ParB N-terminal domain-containing protein [Umezakia ovalisporum CS-1034]
MPIVPIDEIRIGSNRRPVKGDKVNELKESIKTNGLLNPITVDEKLNLIAGLHRLTACKLLGLKTVECHIVNYNNADQSRLAEIDENLIRNELEPLERSELWFERDQILERMGLRAKVGDNQYTAKGSETVSPPLKRTVELAKEVGYSERTFQHGKQIAKSIHSEVKEIIKSSPIADSPTALLNIARAGSQERLLAEASQKAWELAEAKGDAAESAKQAKLIVEARGKQKELQLLAYKSAMAQREAKLTLKKGERQPQLDIANDELGVKVGEEWMLGRHLVYCDHTASSKFRNLLPSDAALAIATLSHTWEHNYLVDEARVVAVLRSQGQIYHFYRHSQMPFQYELVLGNLYVGIFSHQSISQPQTPINIDNVEGIVNYLINLYTNHNNFVIAPFMGNGEILIACERMGRICFIGDENLQLVHRGMMRWQRWTGKLPQKIGSIDL